jgi:integrase
MLHDPATLADLLLGGEQAGAGEGILAPAVRKLSEALRSREQGIAVSTDRRTVGEYLEWWFAAVKKHGVKASSHYRYGADIRVHLIPGLGKHQLTKLTARHMQTLLTAKLDAAYAVSTVQHFYVVLHNALDDAVRLGLLPRNVADMVKPPRVLRHKFAIYTEE